MVVFEIKNVEHYFLSNLRVFQVYVFNRHLMCLLWFLEEKLIVSLKNIKQVGCVMENESFL